MLRKLQDRRKWLSDRLIQYVDIVFAVVIGQAIVRNIDLVRHPLSLPFAALALFVVIGTVTLSWIGYHKSMYEYPYQADLRSVRRTFRPFTDFFIVVVYTFFLFTVDDFRLGPDKSNLFPFLLSYALIFSLYIVDGIIRIFEYNDSNASKWNLNATYLAIYFLILLGYTVLLRFSVISVEVLNWATLTISGIVYIAYRWQRDHHYKSIISSKKRRMILVVDVDGVLADQVTPVLDELNSRCGSHYVKADIRHWDEPLPLASTDIKTAIESSHHDPDFVRKMKPLPNAQAVLREISKYLDISIATNRTAVADKPTREWLNSNGIAHSQYHNTSLEGKGKVDGDIIVDDYPKNILAFVAKGNRKGIVFTQPWNEDDTSLLGKEGIFRAKDWIEVWKIIDSFDELPF
jgi:5'(3')-deoxyribonucleotidase